MTIKQNILSFFSGLIWASLLTANFMIQWEISPENRGGLGLSYILYIPLAFVLNLILITCLKLFLKEKYNLASAFVGLLLPAIIYMLISVIGGFLNSYSPEKSQQSQSNNPIEQNTQNSQSYKPANYEITSQITGGECSKTVLSKDDSLTCSIYANKILAVDDLKNYVVRLEKLTDYNIPNEVKPTPIEANCIINEISDTVFKCTFANNIPTGIYEVLVKLRKDIDSKDNFIHIADISVV